MIKKLILGVILLMAFASAKPITGGIDKECQAFGYDYGVAKYQFNEDIYQKDELLPGYSFTVTGDASQLSWTSDKSIAGVITKSGKDSYSDWDGGTTGMITNPYFWGISHVTFCQDKEDVPEFSTIGAGILVAALGSFIFIKRR